MCFADPRADDAGAGPDEGHERAEPRRPGCRQVRVSSKCRGEGRQIRGNRLPAGWIEEIRPSPESETRAVFELDLETQRRCGDMAEPELECARRPEVSSRTGWRTIAAAATAVQRRRSHARTVPIRKYGLRRAIEAESGLDIEIASGCGCAARRHARRDRRGEQAPPPDPRSRTPGRAARAHGRFGELLQSLQFLD